jgi:neutral ceramidase
VLVLAVRDQAGSMRGALVNYACHPVTLGWRELGISKDYVEFTDQVLASAWGPGAVPVFLQGCAGNVNPRWVYDRTDVEPLRPDWPDPLEERLKETRRLGRMLGGEALAAAESIMRFERTAPLDARRVEVSLPLRQGMRDEDGPPTPRPDTRYPCRAERIARDPRAIATEVQVLRVGPSYLVGLPGEIFVEYQIELRQRIRSPFVFVSGLAGDYVGYVTPPAAFAEGGYEPTATFVTPEAGGILVEAALGAVRSMETAR